jgi:hypothetical protein
MPEKLTLVAGDYDIKSRSSHPKRASTHKRNAVHRVVAQGSDHGEKTFSMSSLHGRADVDHFRFVPTVARPASMKAFIS